jgi:hypothetical protein
VVKIAIVAVLLATPTVALAQWVPAVPGPPPVPGSSYGSTPSYTGPSYGYRPPAPTYSPPAPSYRPPTPTTTYDYQSGNRYTTTPQYGGGVTVRGSNLNTGTNWTTRVTPDGRQSGTDASGAYWTFNPSTGTYFNYGTGVHCTGTGAARVCSGGN